MENNNEENNERQPENSSKRYKGMPSFNPSGRPKGSTNKNSVKQIRTELANIQKDKVLPLIMKRLDKMSDRNLIEFCTKILPYIMPSLSASKIESELTENRNISVNISYGKEKPAIDPGDEHKEDQSDIDDADFTDVE